MNTQQLFQQHHATVEATGRGTASARPDVALLRLGVVTQAKEPKQATSENAQTIAKVLAALKALKVPDEAIQTSGLSLQPQYEWDEPNKKNVLVGYRAEHTVTVKTEVEKAGEIYDAGVAAGANEAGGIQLTLADDSPLRKEALQKATKAAVAEIHAVGEALGVVLIGPIQAQVLAGGGPRPLDLMRAAESADTPIAAGMVEVVTQVRVSFEIKHP
jgi:uncharacterized protein YggE